MLGEGEPSRGLDPVHFVPSSFVGDGNRHGEQDNGPIQRVHLVIVGRVQGVWYRASTRNEAVRRGVLGTAKNLDDGSVEVFAEGARDQLEGLIQWCWDGPPMARVTGIDVRWGDAEGGFEAFTILR
ncbi:MAG: acylphosphatase [Proteobacteria bacterium]|nr:acylphosphatase [Pseudomonadota bacterium]